MPVGSFRLSRSGAVSFSVRRSVPSVPTYKPSALTTCPYQTGHKRWNPFVEILLHQPVRDTPASATAPPGVAVPIWKASSRSMYSWTPSGAKASTSASAAETCVAIDEIGKGKEVQPVIALFVERPSSACSHALPPASSALLLCLWCEVVDQQRAHSASVAHLLDHHASERRAVVITGRVSNR